MSEQTFLLGILLLFGTTLLVFGMKYLSAAYQARSRAASEGAYRELAEKAVSAQSANAAALSAVQTELSEIGTRLAAVVKILKDVE